MPPFEIGCLLFGLGASFGDWVPPFRIGCLLLRLGASFGDWVPPFEIGCLLWRSGASFSDWVPPLEIGCLLFGLGLSDWVFLFALYCSSVWPPDFRSLIGVRIRPVQIEYYRHSSRARAPYIRANVHTCKRAYVRMNSRNMTAILQKKLTWASYMFDIEHPPFVKSNLS